MSRHLTGVVVTACAVVGVVASTSYLARSAPSHKNAHLSAPSSSSAPYTEDNQTSSDRYPNTGLTIEPPSSASSPEPTVTADQAWTAVNKAGSPFLSGTGKQDPHVKLVSLTDTMRGVTQADGTFVPEYAPRLLVWLVELPHAPVFNFGSNPAASKDTELTAFLMVDAHTGEPMESLQAAELHL